MKKLPIVLAAAAALFVLLLMGGAVYTVHETEIAIVTQFGGRVGEPVREPGLHWKTPFVQEVHRLEKRVLEFDGQAIQMATRDKKYIVVDTFARWRIGDAARYFEALRDERSAHSRLEDVIGSEMRTAVANHELLEIVRSGKKLEQPPEGTAGADVKVLPEVRRGRLEIEADVLAASAPKLKSLGIALEDVRIKRVNYNQDVLTTIYQRMISEREQIAQRFRSEGAGEAARIQGKMELRLREIESIAYKEVQRLRGEADAEASRLYAEAYDQTPEAREFYAFGKTLETYRHVLGSRTNMVLSTDSDLFRLLKSAR